MKKIIIAAISSNGIIGSNNKIPWNIKEELLHFKNTTTGFPIIMGRKTFESLRKPLANRLSIIISKNGKYKVHNKSALVFSSLGNAYKYLRKENYSKVFICGGTSIYNIAIRNADEMIISFLKFEAEGDRKFPKINYRLWKVYRKEEYGNFVVHYFRRIKINKN